MPDLPGSNAEKDKEMLGYVLSSPDLRVDQMKIYPHSVVPWTKTKKWLDSGRFTPYSDIELRDVLVWFKQRVHPWIRLNRVVRDIPGHYISGGNSNTSLRQEILAEMKRNGLACRCIRCREVRNDKHKLDEIDLVIREYPASDGTEFFISYETPDRKTICGFCRLRITNSTGWIEPPTEKNLRQRAKKLRGDSVEIPEEDLERDENGRQLIFPELQNAALVRELHVYGKLISTSAAKGSRDAQHIGLGTRMMLQAEKIARAHGKVRFSMVLHDIQHRQHEPQYPHKHCSFDLFALIPWCCFPDKRCRD